MKLAEYVWNCDELCLPFFDSVPEDRSSGTAKGAGGIRLLPLEEGVWRKIAEIHSMTAKASTRSGQYAQSRGDAMAKLGRM